MKHLIAMTALVACVLGWLGVLEVSADRDSPRAGGGKTMFKAVIHVNFDDAERQKHGLKNVTNMLTEEKSSEIHVVCHGSGIGLLVKEKSAHAEEVARLTKDGVRFVACENTLKDKSISKDDLLPGVATVTSGAVEVVRKQQDGFGYFRP